MIVLFTDFGNDGLYVGQMEAVLHQKAPGVERVQLMNNAPKGNPRLSAYLLAALCDVFPEGSVFLCVVDPGVGGDRLPVILKSDGRWFVGPDNGLLNSVVLQAEKSEWWVIEWRPEKLSPSFHGRDLFAPIAAQLAVNQFPIECKSYKPNLQGWPKDIAEVVYIDHYGNAVIGWRYSSELDGNTLLCDGLEEIHQATTFCSVDEGQPFWYCNSSGLLEVAVNQGRADQVLGLSLGSEIRFVQVSTA